jgi:C-terminal processing protease CtpA/Prc
MAPSRLDKSLLDETLKATAATIREEYFDAELAAKIDREINQWLEQGRYAEIKSLDSLAAKLTRDLLDLTRDKHLAVAVVGNRQSAAATDGESDESREAVARRSNFGVQRVELLAGNVGYLNLTDFYRPNEARDVISAAMRTLRHADALILDVRRNGGGSPDTAALLASYFFNRKGLPLFEIEARSGESRGYATESSDIPERDEKRPVYVLTSARTFSAGEGIAFLLQERGRAKVVGESTAGAANPGRVYPINAHFEATIPNGKVRSAVRGTNWEGEGVIPDVKVSADDALRVAHVHALERLIAQTKAGMWRDALERHLEAVKR